ncbi:hypothetical protein [Mycoplasma sp. ATU-Cv-508]|uniref:hypothetical protein n=1 Tax=Mycoplasma sp. ATU-Cv-508 TaxID=2048001 RepID=UPI0013752F8E
MPLIEIVSEPDLSSAQEAHEYVNLIRLIAQTLNISDAKMEEGSLRADINISLNKPQSDGYGTKVEIKNLNSLQNILKAVEFETQVQTKTLDSGQKVVQATKRFWWSKWPDGDYARKNRCNWLQILCRTKHSAD